MDLLKPGRIIHNSNRQLSHRQYYLVPLSVLVFVLAWALIARFSGLPDFIFPGPGQVWARALIEIGDGSLLSNALVTLGEVLLGLVLGSIAAASLGYLLAKSPTIERWLSPYIVASQAIPIAAIAPLLVIWLGPGLPSKVLICALIVFFPELINTIIGLRSVPEDLRDLMRSLGASRGQMLRLLELPAALPVLLGGLRIGATLAVIGAVVGELIGANRGLGFLINVGRGQYDTPLVYVAVFTLVIMALGLYGVVALLEARWLAWQRPRNNG